MTAHTGMTADRSFGDYDPRPAELTAEAFPVFTSCRTGQTHGASVTVARDARMAAARLGYDTEKVRAWCAVYTTIAVRACK